MSNHKAKRIYLSPPNATENERNLILDAFDSNWLAPLGPHVDAFEEEFAKKTGCKYAVAVSSGTAALHLALKIIGVEKEDEVLTSSFTFIATANAIRYLDAKPVFIDCEAKTWNMDPTLLEKELIACRKKKKMPAAVLVVDVLGQCADFGAIAKLCENYDVPLIEDAAEALGASFKGCPAGSFGSIGCFSFNGNKIITTSGGGMLVTNSKAWAEQARYLATQARQPAAHYEHKDVGFNYRLSNLLAAFGRGQLARLDEIVAKRRANFEIYHASLANLPGVHFMPEPQDYLSTRWLTCATFDPSLFGANREQIRLALERENIESRPTWKPMHLQPVNRDFRFQGGEQSEWIFNTGLCLPSGTALRAEDLNKICDIVKSLHNR